jgi:Flp pilus assembly protein TadG
MQRCRPPRQPPRARARQCGTAIIEFALTLTLLATLLLGGVEVSRALRDYNTVVKNTATAARYLSQRTAGNGNDLRLAAISEAKNIVVYGKPFVASGDPALVPGLLPRHVSVRDWTGADVANDNYRQAVTASVPVNLVTVTVSGLIFVPITSWLLPPFTFGPISVTMLQVAG